MLGRTLSFIRLNNRLTFWSALLLVAALFLLTIASQFAPVRLLAAAGFVRADRTYWIGYLPLAQFAGGACLAYLALDMFRHATAIGEQIRKLLEEVLGKSSFDLAVLPAEGSGDASKPAQVRVTPASSFNAKPTAEETKAFAEAINQLKVDDWIRNPQIVMLASLMELNSVRDTWLRDKDGSAADHRRALTIAIERANNSPWFRRHLGRCYLRHFHVGGDTLLVSTGLSVAMWIHVMATLESHAGLYIPAPFASAAFADVLTAVLFLIGVCCPVYFVLTGRAVTDELREIAERAREQLGLIATSFKAMDLATVEAYRDTLSPE